MMILRRLLILFFGGMLLLAVWLFIWTYIDDTDVDKMKQSVQYEHDQFKQHNDNVTFKVEKARASGFPFVHRLVLIRPTLTMISGNETFAVSLEKLELARVNGTTYRLVHPPQEIQAIYASNGNAPEQYLVTWNETPELTFIAADETSPLTKFSVVMPSQLILEVSLRGQTKKIGFAFTPMPITQEIPSDISRPLSLFVGMLREAMIYQKGL